ncbi:beta-1,6-N-acetylglucosaminyltransferase [Photobacterium leiognathi]|uniref:beta-1,6-N-acetylglucosaminyltransferase n=1 Tax=Photobacterium leiognathi TaxID=553611 RepID=UPI0029829F7E|nr:beta-1,6-N-acetylglucosaminyltransferase [Photobacterium leiognathi]
MKIIYGIQCHKNLNQICSLIDSLKLSDNDYAFIHVDKKSDFLFNDLFEKYNKYHNIIIIKDRIDVNWSGFSQVLATLKIISLIKTMKIKYDFFCLISGEDCLLQNSYKLKKFLKNNNKSFVDYSNDATNYLWRINCFNFFREHKKNRSLYLRLTSKILTTIQKKLKITRKNFNVSEIHIGSQWFTLKSSHLDKIYEKIDDCLLNNFKYTSCADEHFFQMLIYKYIPQDEIVKNNLHYIVFDNGESSPKYLSINDLTEKKQKNKNLFFARKIDEKTMLNWNKNHL